MRPPWIAPYVPWHPSSWRQVLTVLLMVSVIIGVAWGLMAVTALLE